MLIVSQIIQDVDFYYDEKWRLSDMLLFIYLCFVFLTVMEEFGNIMQKNVPKLF